MLAKSYVHQHLHHTALVGKWVSLPSFLRYSKKNLCNHFIVQSMVSPPDPLQLARSVCQLELILMEGYSIFLLHGILHAWGTQYRICKRLQTCPAIYTALKASHTSFYYRVTWEISYIYYHRQLLPQDLQQNLSHLIPSQRINVEQNLIQYYIFIPPT